MTQAAAPAGYRPRSATNKLKELVEDHLDELFGVWDERFRPQYGSLCQIFVVEEEDLSQELPEEE